MQVLLSEQFTRKKIIRDSSWYPLERGCPLNIGFTVAYNVSTRLVQR